MKTYMFDVDGVLADFVLGATTIMNEQGVIGLDGVPVEPYPTREQKQWDFQIPAADKERLWKTISESPSFWAELRSLVTPQEAKLVSDLNEEHIVYFTTSRAGRGNSKHQTEAWLRDVIGVVNPAVIVTPNKGEFAMTVSADYCIDDKAGNAMYVAWHTRNAKKPTKSYLLEQQYNKYDPNVAGSKVIRIPTVAEFIAATKQEK